MRPHVVQSIKLIKESMKKDKKDKSPKRNQPLSSKYKQQDDSALFFNGLTFCLAFVNKQISFQEQDIIKTNILVTGGKPYDFFEKVQQTIDYVLVHPKADINLVRNLLKGKIKYKQILDFNFYYQCIKRGYRVNFQKFSLYVNFQDDNIQNISPKKKRKTQSQSQNDTIKLDDISVNQKKQQLKQMLIKDNIDQEKRDMEEEMLNHFQKRHFSVNQYIAQQLSKLMKIYATQRDLGRKLAYMKAAAAIRALDKQIQSQKDVQNLRGIGKKISDKIKQLLSTGKIKKLQTLQGSEKITICSQFCKIWGVGPSKANELYAAGFRTFDDIKQNPYLLSKNQKIGLKYFQDFQKKIPRQKVSRIFEHVKKIISRIVGSLQNYRIQVCGSYRREKPFCGDIDIIISRKDGVYQKNLLKQIVNQLQRQRFLTDHLTHPKIPDNECSISYMGVCRFEDNTHHRIDLKYYPINQYAFAILYFTGSGNFNRMLRIHCMKLGLNLSDHSVTPKMQNGIIFNKKIPQCLTEEDIFNFLNVQYKHPKDRDL